MFNTTIHNSKVVAVTKEIEKTISPDKVVEMYDTVREEVEEKILRSVHISSNVMDAVAIEIQPRYDVRTTDYAIRFTLNGSEHISRGTFNEQEMHVENRMHEKVWEIYNRAITTALMKDTIREMTTIFSPNVATK